MRRRGIMIIVIALVAAGFFGTWTLAYRSGETSGRNKVSADRSAFGTRVAAGQPAGAGGQGGGAPGGAGGAGGTRGQGGGSAVAGTGATDGAAGTRGPGGGSAVAGAGNVGQGANGTPGAGRQGGATSNLTGKVMKVDGTTLSVQQSDNTTISVTTTADTAVRKLVAGALTDLKAGDIVTVDGSKTGDNAYSAKSVTSLGSVPGGGGGGNGGGGRGQGGPPAGATAPAVTGQIKSVSGGTIMVQAFDGSTATVTTTATTMVRTQQSGTLGDIKTGDTLLIQGDKTSDTAFLARTITNQGATG